MIAEAENSSYTPEQIAAREAEEIKMARKPFYPDDWHNSFGVPVEDHSNVTLESITGYGSFASMNRVDKE